jgi:hypothetical protein
MSLSHTAPLKELAWVERRLTWMRANRIWPNGLRYLWTDAFGVVLAASLYRDTRDAAYKQLADAVIEGVERVLGRPRGIRIGEEPERYGQYAHYHAVWLFAQHCMYLVTGDGSYRERALRLIGEIHDAFVTPNGVWWKMREDLSAPEPGHGFGGLDHYKLFTVYRLIDGGTGVLARQIADVQRLVNASYRGFRCDQDLGLGISLWSASHFPEEAWARTIAPRCLGSLDAMWVQVTPSTGYFARAPWLRDTAIAFANYGVGIGAAAAGAWPERIRALNQFFETFDSRGEYMKKAITWVMAAASHYPGLWVPSELAAATLEMVAGQSVATRQPSLAAAAASGGGKQPLQQPKNKGEEQEQRRQQERGGQPVQPS